MSSADTGVIMQVSSLLEARDGVPPPSLTNYFNRFDPSTVSECINIVIHLNMLEVGFVLKDTTSGELSLPPCWKELVATFKYIHPGFQNFECSIALVTMGSVKQVLASFCGQESEIMIKLNIGDYFPNGVSPQKIVKLALLSKTLRNDLLYPLQIAAHQKLGLPAPWHIAGLPSELVMKVMTMLSLKDVMTLSVCCKRLNTCSMDNKLWYNLFRRRFKEHFHSSDTVSGADWRSKYKEIHLRERRAKRAKEEEEQELLHEIHNPHRSPLPDDPFSPFNPSPFGPHPHYPQPNPYLDPDSPYFGGEIPFPQPGNHFGIGRRPRNPSFPSQPPYMPFMPRPSSGGPRFDFI